MQSVKKSSKKTQKAFFYTDSGNKRASDYVGEWSGWYQFVKTFRFEKFGSVSLSSHLGGHGFKSS